MRGPGKGSSEGLLQALQGGGWPPVCGVRKCPLGGAGDMGSPPGTGCNGSPIPQVLGTPTREQIREMNPNYTEFKFPQIKAHPWLKVLEEGGGTVLGKRAA